MLSLQTDSQKEEHELSSERQADRLYFNYTDRGLNLRFFGRRGDGERSTMLRNNIFIVDSSLDSMPSTLIERIRSAIANHGKARLVIDQWNGLVSQEDYFTGSESDTDTTKVRYDTVGAPIDSRKYCHASLDRCQLSAAGWTSLVTHKAICPRKLPVYADISVDTAYGQWRSHRWPET